MDVTEMRGIFVGEIFSSKFRNPQNISKNNNTIKKIIRAKKKKVLASPKSDLSESEWGSKSK